tara:strand:+ start:2002 stop:2355 length:354 start_codon:yes stop_codon:yes gene_type:complete
MADIGSDTYEKLGIIGTLVVIGGAMVRWLLGDRKSIEKKLADAESRERETSQKRSSDLLKASEMLADSSSIIKESLAENTRSIHKNSEELKGLQREFEILQTQLNELARVTSCSTGS